MRKVVVLHLMAAAMCLLPVTLLHAQSRGSGRTGGASTPSSIPSLSEITPRSFFLSGKVVVDDGSVLTDPAAVQSTCKGRVRTEGLTDAKGRFTFEISSMKENGGATDEASDSSQGLLGQGRTQSGFGQGGISADQLRDYWKSCRLQAILPGFSSDFIDLAGKLTGMGTTDLGTIVLHRMDQVQGFTLSATSSRAPSKAKKDYEKGRDLERKEKPDEAIESFRTAVEAYPEYAVAWLEMGRLQAKKGDSAAARQSFHKALSADAKFVSPYQELAQLAAHERQWQEAIEATDALLKLNPVSFPQDWLLNATAYYYLRNFDAAEKSAQRGLELDTQHQVPKLEYLMGLIVAEKHDYSGALEHIRTYLRLSPHAGDADIAKKQAEQLEQLAKEGAANKQ